MLREFQVYGCWRLLDTHGQAWASLLWGCCSFLLGPGAQGSVCALQESVSKSCLSSGGSMVGLMVTSSKRVYAIPRSTAPRAPAPVAVHQWPIPLQEMFTVLSQSLWGLWVLECTRFVWALGVSLMGKGFDSKCNFAPIILLGLLLCPCMWPLGHSCTT